MGAAASVKALGAEAATASAEAPPLEALSRPREGRDRRG